MLAVGDAEAVELRDSEVEGSSALPLGDKSAEENGEEVALLEKDRLAVLEAEAPELTLAAGEAEAVELAESA